MSAAAVFFGILRVLGILFLILLTALLILLLVPAGIRLCYENDVFTADITALGLRVRLFPRPQCTKKKKKTEKTPQQGKKESAKKQEKKEVTAKKGGPAQIVQEALRTQPVQKLTHILQHGGKAARFVLRRLHVRHIQVYWPVTGKDAAATAIQFGAATAAAGCLFELAQEKMHFRADSIWFEPDYTGELTKKRRFACQITAQLYIILIAGGYLFYKVTTDPVLKAGPGAQKGG